MKKEAIYDLFFTSFSWVDDGARTHDPQNHNLML